MTQRGRTLRFPVPPANAELVPYRDNQGKMVLWDYAALLEYAEGDIANVFGPRYAEIDKFKCRVRLPQREYLLVSRVTKMDAETGRYSTDLLFCYSEKPMYVG